MEKDSTEFGKHAVVGSFVNNSIGIRRADGSLVATGINIYAVVGSFVNNSVGIRKADGSLVATGISIYAVQWLVALSIIALVYNYAELMGH